MSIRDFLADASVIVIYIHYIFIRAAYRLAGSFNLRGRLRQLFHVLTDDKIGSGPRPAPHSLQHPPKSTDQEESLPDAGAAGAATAGAAANGANEPAASDQVEVVAVKSTPASSIKRKATDSGQHAKSKR